MLVLLGAAQRPASAQTFELAQAPKVEPAPGEEDKGKRERPRNKDEKGPPPSGNVPAPKAQAPADLPGKGPPTAPPADKKSPSGPAPPTEGRRPIDVPKGATPEAPERQRAPEKTSPVSPKPDLPAPQGRPAGVAQPADLSVPLRR